MPPKGSLPFSARENPTGKESERTEVNMSSLVQFLIIFSIFIITIIIARLYRGIRLLNSRVDLLSSLLKKIRLELLELQKLEEDHLAEFFSYDSELNSELKKDFRSKRLRGLERLQSLKMTDSYPTPSKTSTGNSPKQETKTPISTEEKKGSEDDRNTLSVYNVGKQAQVKVKKDLSYLVTSSQETKGAVAREEIPDLPISPASSDEEKSS